MRQGFLFTYLTSSCQNSLHSLVIHPSIHPSIPINHPSTPFHPLTHSTPLHSTQRHPNPNPMPPTLAELRFLRTLTPPARGSSSGSDSDSTDYDPYRSPTPENTTGVEFDGEDEVWRCTHCGWEVETVDGVQGYCREGHEVGFFLFSW